MRHRAARVAGRRARPHGLAGRGHMSHPVTRMLKLTLPLLLLLPFASRLHAQECDQRILPRPDTLSVEAAARAATKLGDVHVQQACIVGTTTAVTLVSPSSGQELK